MLVFGFIGLSVLKVKFWIFHEFEWVKLFHVVHCIKVYDDSNDVDYNCQPAIRIFYIKAQLYLL